MNMRAIWNGQVLAESDNTIYVEGNHYFPPDSLNKVYFNPSEQHSTCFWKGVASYYNLEVDGEQNQGAAWTYPEPSRAVANIRDHVAFWRGVKIEPVP